MNTTPTPAPAGPADHMPATFSLSDFENTFSKEEIEALTTGDDPIELSAAAAAPAKPADAGPGLDEQADETADLAEQAQQQAAAAQQPAPAAPDEGRMPVFEVPDTSKAAATLQQLDAALDTVQQKYDAGDLTAAEFRAEVARVSKEQAAAERVIQDAEDVIRDAQAEANRQWLAQIQAFEKQAGNAVLFAGDHRAGFDAALKRVTADPANANLTFKTMINMAATGYAAEYKARTGQDVAVQTTQTQKTAAKLEPLKTERPDAPQLLGQLNGDSNMSVNDGTFTALDRTLDKDPLAGEALLSRMTPEQQEAYLLGG